jgi:hypothetical protein
MQEFTVLVSHLGRSCHLKVGDLLRDVLGAFYSEIENMSEGRLGISWIRQQIFFVSEMTVWSI